VLPVIILVAVAIPVLVVAFLAVRRKLAPAGRTAVEQSELEREFADAERYEAEWRDEQRKHPHDESLY
jgi:hypothetical protein